MSIFLNWQITSRAVVRRLYRHRKWLAGAENLYRWLLVVSRQLSGSSTGWDSELRNLQLLCHRWESTSTRD